MSDKIPTHQDLSQHTLEEIQATIAINPLRAAEKAREFLTNEGNNASAHRLLALALRRLGHYEEAARADANGIQASAQSAPLQEALQAMRAKQVVRAEQILRSYLAIDPHDPQALRMLAEIAAVCGHAEDAERLLRTAIDQAPGFIPLYINLAALLQDVGRGVEAMALLDALLSDDPTHILVLSFKAVLLAGSGRTFEALQVYEGLLVCAPDAKEAWINYAELLKAVGRINDSEAAYRNALKLDSACSPAWWGLASLRTIKLSDDDIERMQRSLSQLTDDMSRLQLQFGLGRALGDQHRFEESFHYYTAANQLRSKLIPYDARLVDKTVDDSITFLTRERLDRNAGSGAPEAGPIFILGMPRSGSTLVEQILASHPQIEGLGELFNLDQLVRQWAGSSDPRDIWSKIASQTGAEIFSRLGADYLASVSQLRRTKRFYFTDKLPSNWLYSSLIHLILPNAKIIDVRRHPIACCFSNFTLHFNRVTNFASSLADIGRHYCAYVRMMDHLDQVLPGRVHLLSYEKLVENPQRETARLLAYLGLPFDEACLRFYENPREVHTPSAGQVRAPVNSEGIAFWRNYEAWLGPLTDQLGPVLGRYPGVLSERP
jgi:tetratricopeptide (TPR) repeat protein